MRVKVTQSFYFGLNFTKQTPKKEKRFRHADDFHIECTSCLK